MTTITKNYDASPAHAKRAKVGDFIGLYEHQGSTVPYVSWVVKKVEDDGVLVCESTGTPAEGKRPSRKTFKPDGKRGNRFMWYYLDMSGYRQNRLVAIQTKGDRDKRDARSEQWGREQEAEDLARAEQAKRNQPMYDKLVAFAEARGLLLTNASTGQYRFRPARYLEEQHATLELLLTYGQPETDLGHGGVELPVEMFLSLANIKD